MAISDQQRDELNNASPVCRDVKLGTEIQNLGKRVAAAQENSVAVDAVGLVADFNTLLARLKAAGLMTNL
ncbi:hypothetical protein ACJDU8_17695 [Clostridium sp. WILCCON 0269]|uniref:Head fiber protein n=1 Tax=Candidatus Clostridium eludens TaxID=3381663 RepID=A0ABW8SMV7_9CLOT